MSHEREIASHTRAAVVAPAGCGKTELVARVVAEIGRRELVLTHTHAGVDALRRRFRKLGIASSRYHLDTIAGWSLRIASSFPNTSGWDGAIPSGDQWPRIYLGATEVLRRRSIHEVIRASYSGVLVDEYQDCTENQHRLILALAGLVPCRVFGDPLQGIFEFRETMCVDWETDVLAQFHGLNGPSKGWRWEKSNPVLGEWLQDVRSALLAGEPVQLTHAPITVARPRQAPGGLPQEQMLACLRAAKNENDTIVALHRWPAMCRKACSKLRGVYSVVEPIEATDLFDFAKRLDGDDGFERAAAVIDFASLCATQVSTDLRSIRKGLMQGKRPKKSKHARQLDALLNVVDTPGSEPTLTALRSIRALPGSRIYRRELLREMERALEHHTGDEPLEETTRRTRNGTRHIGRRLQRCSVGTTLLVKGLEFDHALLLDPHGYDARNLYVALTRGSRALTIVSSKNSISPAARK